MQTPTVNAQQAGQIATSADMNNYAAACTFLLAPPIAYAKADPGGQSITSLTVTAINWTTPDIDRDGTWSAGSPARFTIQTAGFYEVSAGVLLTNAANVCEGFLTVTTGSSSPQGAGVVSDYWHTSSTAPPAGRPVSLITAGLLPQYLYVNDYLQFRVQTLATAATASTNGWRGNWSHKMVSM